MSNLVQTILKPGVQFSLKNQAFEVAFADATTVRYAACQGGKSYQVPTQTFWELVDQNAVGFLSGQSPPSKDIRGRHLLMQMSESMRLEMLRRYGYVKAVLSVEKKPLSRNNLMRVIRSHSEKISDSSIPGSSTLANWVKNYARSGGDVTSLVPLHCRKGSRTKKFPLEVENLIVRSVRDQFLTKERPSVSQIYCNIVGQALENPDLDGKVSLPSARTIYRRISEMDPYIVAAKRHGQRYADRHFRAAGASLVASRLMEMVMIDGHRMDVLLIDEETGEILGRPYATCAFDVCTRTVVGWHISLFPFCAATALAAIKDMCSRNPLEGPGGVAEKIIPDNGPDLASGALRNLCAKVGMHVLPAKAYCPDDKAHIERFFRTLNVQFVHLLKGTTFSSPEQRGDYDSKGLATFTLDRLKAHFEQWLNTIYHIHLHAGTGRAPILHWRDQQAANPILNFSKEDIDAIARIVYKRQINNGRVIVNNLSYKSHALATLEQRGMRDVTVLVDELDLDFVYVQHHSDQKLLIKAESVNPGYTKGLTKYEHDEVQKRISALTKKDVEELGVYAYEIARWRLWCEIHDLPNSQSARKLRLLTNGSGRKKVAKKKMAVVEQGANKLGGDAVSTDYDHPPMHPPFIESRKKSLSNEVAKSSDGNSLEDEDVSVAFDTFDI